MHRNLVAYFSASGMTREAASQLASVIEADLFEIKASQPYTAADLDWNNNQSRSSLEKDDPDCRPEIADRLEDLGQYDTVFIGFPIWWYVAPKIIHSFLESYDFSGKTLVPFATSGGSGLGKTVTILKELCPLADWKEGQVINHLSKRALADWAASCQ